MTLSRASRTENISFMIQRGLLGGPTICGRRLAVVCSAAHSGFKPVHFIAIITRGNFWHILRFHRF